MKNEKNHNVLDDLQEVLDTMDYQVSRLPDLYKDVMSMGMGMNGDTPMNSRDIADELRGEYIDLTPDLVEEAQRDGSVMTNFLPQLEKAFSAEILVKPELFGIGKSCTWRFLDKLRISDN